MNKKIDVMLSELIRALCEEGYLHKAEKAADIEGRSLTQDEFDKIAVACIKKKDIRTAVSVAWPGMASAEAVDLVVSACIDEYNGFDAVSREAENLAVDILILIMIKMEQLDRAKAFSARLVGRPPLTEKDIVDILEQWSI